MSNEKRTLATLENLLSLAEEEVENAQRSLAHAQNMVDQAKDHAAQLEKRATQGLVDAENDHTLMPMAMTYHTTTMKEVRRMEKEVIPLLEAEVEKRRETLAEAFSSQKRYEIILRQKREEIKKRREKAAQNQLDEIAADRHTRKS